MIKIKDTEEYKGLEFSETRVITDYLELLNSKNEEIKKLNKRIDFLTNVRRGRAGTSCKRKS